MPKPQLQNKLREERARQNVTQDELALAVGVARQTIIAVEQNRYSPSLTMALLIAKKLQKPVDELFELE